ncbi:MAG: hypothetical protein QOI49_354 [Verrucomicrobiota bacterium]|jgi:hypothetical protein
MTSAQQTLAQAKDNPYELFTVKELAAIHVVSDEVISCCFKMGAKNHFGMSRPEWIMEFLHVYAGSPLQCKSAPKRPRNEERKSG